jgi:hypothetical protein
MSDAQTQQQAPGHNPILSRAAFDQLDPAGKTAHIQAGGMVADVVVNEGGEAPEALPADYGISQADFDDLPAGIKTEYAKNGGKIEGRRADWSPSDGVLVRAVFENLDPATRAAFVKGGGKVV